MVKYICCFSGGKDSTAMLIHILKNNLPLDEILYVDVGDWIWESAKTHLKQVEEMFNVDITVLDVTDDLQKGFERWGFPSFFNRWCTGVKKEAMRIHIRDTYGKKEDIIQYIGYCSDEEQRTGGKLYSTYDAEYPLVDAGITTDMALEICKEYGFDFGGVYEHHSHFNCWLCPLQGKGEVYGIFKDFPEYWNILRDMQHQTDGCYLPNETIFDLEKQFWDKTNEEKRKERLNARNKYNTR